MKQILCFGDSNTYGLIPGTKARYDWNIRWSGILGERMRPYGYRVVEEGLCGRTTVFDDHTVTDVMHRKCFRLFLKRIILLTELY